ncbi:hypothetical protein [Burkholderia perseverans]|uniref:hypothetical protein n=1 Tax=Burkholderia perseverans TaxID=2615214 RepID=UPI001FEF0B4D|nr:hypothetical protein [Burkholderia perseverans]
MQTIAQKITAANGYMAAMAGRTLYVQTSDAGNVLTITLTDVLGNRAVVQNVGAGAKLTPASGFTSVAITTTADSNVAFIVTQGDIDIQLNQTAVQVANGSGNPVPVAIVSEPGAPFPVTVQGSVTVTGVTLTATNVGINNTTANPVPVLLQSSADTVSIPVQVQPPASAPADGAPVVVGTSGAALVAAAAGRRSLRVRNAGPGLLALTAAAGTTFASAAVVIQVGDTYIERDAPQAAWYAVSDTGTNANIQTVS